MRSRSTIAAPFGLTLLGLTLFGGCAQDESQQPSLADRTALAACRQRADQVYERLNRDQIYNVTTSGRDTPWSGTYFSNNPSRGLTDQYSHDVMVRDCVRDTGSEADRAPAAGAAGSAPGASLPAAGAAPSKP
jgi:hypothetical protein